MQNNQSSIKQNGLKSNLFFSVLLKLLTYMVPLVTAPYISRVLGPEGVGEYSYANSIVSYFALIVNFGFVGYGTLRISANRHNKEKYSGYFWSIIVVRSCLLLVALLSYVVLLTFVLKPGSLNIYLLLSLTIFANFFDITYLFQGLENFKIISIISCTFRIIGACALFVFVKERDDLLVYVIIQTLQLLLVAVVPWFFASNTILHPKKNSIDLKDTLRNSFFFFLPTLSVTLCSLIDKTMLGSIRGTKEVAFYEQADKIIVIVVNVLHAFAPVFSSRISYYVKENREAEIQSNIIKMAKLYFAIGLPSILGLYAIKTSFIPAFFGVDFMPSVGVITFLIPLILILSSSNAIGNVYYAPRNLIWMTSIFYGIGTIINIAVNSFLIPKHGATGAAIASLLSESITTFLFVFFSRNSINYLKVLKTAYKPFLASVIMLTVLLIVNTMLFKELGDVSTSIIDFAIGVFTYGISIVLLKDEMVMTEINVIKNKIIRL